MLVNVTMYLRIPGHFKFLSQGIMITFEHKNNKELDKPTERLLSLPSSEYYLR
jgi:hypothetical protein